MKQKIKAKFVVDRLIGAKILFAADGKLQNYLENCRMAEDRTEVDDSILNFNEIVRDIANNRFFIDLPPSFSPEEERVCVVTPSASSEKKRKREDDDNERVPNKYPVPGVGLEKGEVFSSTFGGKLINLRPKWGSKKMCVC